MAKVTYEVGLRCKQCGDVSITFNRYHRQILCQKCGAHIMNYYGGRRGKVTDNAESVTVKVTRKLFSTTYEVV